MITIKPSVTLLHVTPDALALIELVGRTCYKSEGRITDETKIPFVRSLLTRGHESVLEHASASVRFVCDRGVSHEIVRHRLASYSQESTRYCDYNYNMEFVCPPWLGETDAASKAWIQAMEHAEEAYKYLRAVGWKPEQARSVLPNSLKTEIVMTANLREWRHFFKLRTAKAAHPQMREVAVMTLALLQHAVPIVFDDIAMEVS